MTRESAVPAAAARWTPEKQLAALAELEKLEEMITAALQKNFPGASASVTHIDWKWRPDEQAR